MTQVYNVLTRHFYAILFVMLLIGAACLHPSFSARLWSWQRQRILDAFISQLETEKTVNPQAFWQFREFYSPGEFAFNPQAVGIFQTLRLVKLSDPETEVLYFHSPKLQSTDSLITTPTLYTQKKPHSAQVLWESERATLYRSGPEELTLIFYASIDEMRTANGFFDYLPSEQELLQGKYWLNQTIITLK